MVYVAYVILLLGLPNLRFIDAATALGIDVSRLVSKDSFKCLKNEGYDFLIVRAYRNNGQPDINATQTIANARRSGFKHIDVYMFPCPTCRKSAKEQVQEMGK